MTSTILHQSSWSKTHGDNNIELFSSRHTTERPVLFVGGVHGDEPEGVELATNFLSWLQKNNSRQLLPWLLIPCLNVDGYKKNERVNRRGVDLNRNFPCRDWSPDAKAPRYFPGPRANSEIETQSLVKIICDEKPQVIFHFHSWEPCVVYTGRPGQPWAELAAEGTGYQAREDIGYPTPGSLGQYGWLEHQTPVICIEAQEHTPLDQIWPRFEKGLTRILDRQFLSKKGLL